MLAVNQYPFIEPKDSFLSHNIFRFAVRKLVTTEDFYRDLCSSFSSSSIYSLFITLKGLNIDIIMTLLRVFLMSMSLYGFKS